MENTGKYQKTVVVGMSGGVDSSVAAWLLKKAGYRVIGATMETWTGREETSEKEGADVREPSAAEDAGRVAEKLSIPHYVLDFRQEFQRRVMDYFVDEYWQGRTPNPCTVCNRFVKWEALLAWSREMGADYIATGHYAKVEHLPDGRYALRECAMTGKDQTYALYNLTQDQLSRTLMPLGDYTKEQVRKIAEEIGLSVADKPDSQEICFIPDHDYAGFIQRYLGRASEPGNFVDREGKVLGQHKGIIHYTIGQRRGLGLSAGHRIFVQEIRPKSNEVVIGEGDEIFSRVLRCNKVNWMGIGGLFGKELTMRVKIRYSHKGEECVVRQIGEDLVECQFKNPVRAVTPGQAAVFYLGDIVAGGGTIL